ncbi:hypothetical protein [Thalassospira marina]|uniref:hypothetical protein n=1 Tax=Thalassospira marina TaxID=2048283 RepID=UPI0012FEEF3C|nr:hypothetical protein [Thalassospira marina]
MSGTDGQDQGVGKEVFAPFLPFITNRFASVFQYESAMINGFEAGFFRALAGCGF